MRNKMNQGHEIRSLVFKKGREMTHFCLKQGQGWSP